MTRSTSAPASRAASTHQPTSLAFHNGFDLLMTLLCAALLCSMAWPLANPDIVAGLHARYGEVLNTTGTDRASQAIWLASNARWLLPAMAVCGWVTLWVARLSLTAWGRASGVTALGLAAYAFVFLPPSDNQLMVLALVFCFGVAPALLAFVLAVQVSDRIDSALPAPLLYPGWVVFTGIGLIWLIDYSARGPVKFQYLALKQYEYLLMAGFVMALASACSAPLAGLLVRVFAAIDPEHGHMAQQPGANKLQRALAFTRRNALPLLFVVWALAVALLSNKRYPATPTELLRLPLYFLGAWVMLRWVSHGHAQRALVMAAIAVMAIAMGHLGLRDMGQVLLLALCLAVVLGVALAARLGAGRMAVLLGLLVTVCAVSFGLSMLVDHGEVVAKLFNASHFAKRLASLATPFAGELDYLSELRWLMASTPSGGHGLGLVPWCGTSGALEISSSCHAAPREIASDYVFAALVASFGAGKAVALTAGVALWLANGVHIRTSQRVDARNLLSWAFACFAVISLVQLTFTALGSLGAVVLTGVSYPLMGNGGAALLCAALMAGLVAKRN